MAVVGRTYAGAPVRRKAKALVGRGMARDQRLVFSLQEGPGYIKGTQFTDVDLAGVSGYVVFLNLENADISDQGIRVLPELPELRGIDLDGTEVTDKAMERI